ncbi:zinc finger protein 682-like isoform X2 [Nycticebus coucang]|nr:zinc finger protein 682-like isoform X2 [Nycticebus coucang]XP_053428603.1 zinc finger protein 682-like isoform X2 [Nycticebus coucang]
MAKPDLIICLEQRKEPWNVKGYEMVTEHPAPSSHSTQDHLPQQDLNISFQKMVLTIYGSCGLGNLKLIKSWECMCEYKEYTSCYNGLNQYSMTNCSKMFQSKKCLFQNLSSIDREKIRHTIERPFKCKECGEAFNQCSHINKHNIIYNGEKTYKSKECGQVFKSCSSFTKLKRICIGEKPYNCKECGKAFNETSYLTKHKRIHTGEKP